MQTYIYVSKEMQHHMFKIKPTQSPIMHRDARNKDAAQLQVKVSP